MMKRAIVFGIVLSVLSLTFGLGYAETPQAPAAESVELSELSAQAVVGQITCAIQTITGNFLTAVGGGGRTTDVLHTDATIIDPWEKFTLIDAGDGSYGLRTVNGHYLTAVGGGGRITDVIHSDAVNLLGWEKFTAYALGQTSTRFPLHICGVQPTVSSQPRRACPRAPRSDKDRMM